MLQILDLTHNNLIATRAEKRLTEMDMEKIHPFIHNILETGQKVRWYLEMEDFIGWNTKGLWKDIKMDLKHANDYEKIAMVGNKQWQEWITQSMKPFTKAEIKYFEMEEKETAIEWINN